MHVPQLDLSRHQWATTCGGQPLPTPVKSQRADQIRVLRQCCDSFSGSGVDQAHFLITAHGQELTVRRKLDRSDGRDDGHLWLNVRNIHFWRRGKHFIQRGPFRAGVNPSTNRFDFTSAEGYAVEGHTGLPLAFQHQDDSAFAALPGNNDRAVSPTLHKALIRLHDKSAHLRRAAVAGEAFLLEDGQHFPSVTRRSLRRRKSEQQRVESCVHNSDPPPGRPVRLACGSHLFHLPRGGPGAV